MRDLKRMIRLEKQLDHHGWKKRVAAVKALGAMRDSHAVELLIKSLGDHYSLAVRKAAAEALGERRDPRAVEPLIQALGDGKQTVRRAAAEALDKLGEPKWIHIIQGDPNDLLALAQSNDPRAFEPLVKALADYNRQVRADAAQALGVLNDFRAVEPLIKALGDRKADVRKTAAEVLALLGESQWKEMIAGDADDFMRLSQSQDPRAAQALNPLSEHTPQKKKS